jgi:hypothetical protein
LLQVVNKVGERSQAKATPGKPAPGNVSADRSRATIPPKR